MIKIMLSGEGPTDYGRTDSFGVQTDGPIQVYMRNIASEVDSNLNLEIIPFDRKRIHVQKKRKCPPGHGAYCMLMTLEAMNIGCDIAAFYVDADKPSSDSKSKSACIKRYKNLKEEIQQGFSTAKGNNEIQTIAIIPVKMVESWIMGDPNSFYVLYSSTGKVDFPKSPELEWGQKQDPNSNYPKNRLKRILKSFHQVPNQDTFCEIAKASSLEVLSRTCPISFADFYTEFSAIIHELMYKESGNNSDS